MPALVQLYIRSCAMGFALAAVFVGLLFWSDVGGLWHLVSTSDVGIIAAVMLFMGNGIIFAGANFAMTILRMEEREPPRSGGRRAPHMVAVPVPVRVDRDPRTVSRRPRDW